MKDPRGRLWKSRSHQEWLPTAAHTLTRGAFHRADPGTCPRPRSFIRSTVHDVNAEPLAHSQGEAHSRSCRFSANRAGNRERGRASPARGVTLMNGGVGDTREDGLMNGRPRMSTWGILIEPFRKRTPCAGQGQTPEQAWVCGKQAPWEPHHGKWGRRWQGSDVTLVGSFPWRYSPGEAATPTRASHILPDGLDLELCSPIWKAVWSDESDRKVTRCDWKIRKGHCTGLSCVP